MQKNDWKIEKLKKKKKKSIHNKATNPFAVVFLFWQTLSPLASFEDQGPSLMSQSVCVCVVLLLYYYNHLTHLLSQ